MSTQAPAVIETTPEQVLEIYKKMEKNLEVVRRRLNRPLPLAEKILLGHLSDPEGQELKRGDSYLLLHPDRVIMQDATAQMAVLQFMQAGISRTAVPTTIHCDHLIQAYTGASADLSNALNTNKEVYKFLESVAQKYGMGFWKPGSGIIHQVVLEQYAFPGGMLIGTDSHSVNMGGLTMIAIGVGGADAVDVMVGIPWEVKYPKLIGCRLVGELSGWTSPKDVILKVASILTANGGTNAIVEYFGPGAKTISGTGKATITNMGAEVGATTSIFPFDDKAAVYMESTERGELVKLARKHMHLLTGDPEVEKDPEKYFDKVIEIDLSKLEPLVTGPHTPDLARPVSQWGKDAEANNWPKNLKYALLGSCTNSSYEDISRAADLAEQAAKAGLKVKIPLMVSPGSEQIRATIERDGQMKKLEAIGAKVLSNSCGPCIGQWKRDDIKKDEPNSIISSFNRNFPKRNDGYANTYSFLTSPELVVAYALGGSMDFNPMKDPIPGSSFKFGNPAKAPEIPKNGFVKDEKGFLAPPADSAKLKVEVDSKSDRLQILDPFPAWDGKDFEKVPVLLKAKGKCTTDHISPAGKWLTYRGHLDNISSNMLSGAVNAFTGEAGKAINQLTGAVEEPQAVARAYKKAGLRWVAVGDTNYGEGSSREHAAMSPRFLGVSAILVRSFARIHESNLKKQGVLPLVFTDPADYEKIGPKDKISIVGLKSLTPGKPVDAVIHHEDGKESKIQCTHTLNPEQIRWFQAGSALNTLSKAG